MNVDVENAIKRIQEIRNELNTVVGDIDDDISKLQHKRDTIAEPYNNEITRYEEIIKSEVLQMSRSYTSGNSKITFVKGYVRYSWIKDKLEGYFKAKGDNINDFREETEVKPQVRIKIE